MHLGDGRPRQVVVNELTPDHEKQGVQLAGAVHVREHVEAHEAGTRQRAAPHRHPRRLHACNGATGVRGRTVCASRKPKGTNHCLNFKVRKSSPLAFLRTIRSHELPENPIAERICTCSLGHLHIFWGGGFLSRKNIPTITVVRVEQPPVRDHGPAEQRVIQVVARTIDRSVRVLRITNIPVRQGCSKIIELLQETNDKKVFENAPDWVWAVVDVGGNWHVDVRVSRFRKRLQERVVFRHVFDHLFHSGFVKAVSDESKKTRPS